MVRSIAEIGEDPTGGISRLAFTAAERQAHDLVGKWLCELGLSLRKDAIGNTFAEHPGARSGLPAIGIGSHLDSVPHGGQFDGIVGVVGALEVVRLLKQRQTRLAHPLRVVAFVAEEGARFGEPCIGSKAVVGLLDRRDPNRIRDAIGTTLAEAMSAVGLDPTQIGSTRWRPRDWAAFLELHIEQARVLEAESRHVGLVDVVSGSTRIGVSVVGRADHSGGTPMSLRADALAAAAELITCIESLANDPRHRGTRATVGRLDVFPNSITTVAGRVTLVVDVRDVDSDRQRETTEEIARQAHYIAERRGVRMDIELIADTSPAVLPMWLRDITSATCAQMGLSYRVMSSGAGHDAQIINRIVPSAMIFVPSRDGLSHVPEEWSSASDIAVGVDALYQSILRLDAFLLEHDGDASGVAERRDDDI
jgi:hydantoinase/carbamoylase family amidase